MIVTRLFDIQKKTSLIYYREEFEARAEYTILGKPQEGRVEFILEVNPLGEKTLQVNLIDKIDYPLIPLVSELKTQIQGFIDKNTLPS